MWAGGMYLAGGVNWRWTSYFNFDTERKRTGVTK